MLPFLLISGRIERVSRTVAGNVSATTLVTFGTNNLDLPLAPAVQRLRDAAFGQAAWCNRVLSVTYLRDAVTPARRYAFARHLAT